MSTCSDPDRPDTDDENSQRSYSNASSPSGSLQQTPNYVSFAAFKIKSEVSTQLPAGSLGQWRPDHRRAEPGPLAVRRLPRARVPPDLRASSRATPPDLHDRPPPGLADPGPLPLPQNVSGQPQAGAGLPGRAASQHKGAREGLE